MWCSLLFPSLPLDVFARGWNDDGNLRPFIVASGGRAPTVVAANASARDAGIHQGQLISAALALAPGLAMRDRDIDAETSALAQLATCALTFTPAVSLVAPIAVVAEIGASLRLFGGVGPLVRALKKEVASRGFDPRIAVAPTPVAALALARAGREDVVARDELQRALAPLPLVHFDLDSVARTTLRATGITTFGELDALPRDGLARRFGPPIVGMLDRALARVPDPRPSYEPPPRFEAKLELPAPVRDAQTLGFAVNRLVHDLSGWLLARGLGAVRLALTLFHEPARMRRHDSPLTTAPFALGTPARAPAHLFGVLRERLARLDLPAPVEAIGLATLTTAPLAGHTLGLLPGADADVALVPLADRLRARLGDRAVMRVSPAAEHRPERALQDHAEALRHAQAPALPPAPRPLWLLRDPQPIGDVFRTHPWILRDGPERIESGWWDGNDVRRDYFVAETDRGEIVWIFRDHRYGTADGEWFLHGVFG